MTELIIDGVQVVLPAEFSVSVKRENPFFTKNGEYTYEITLSLVNPTNAALYGFLSRINSVADIKKKRSAVLIADNRVYCNGTEVITGWTDKEVNVQIVSGNSELNYFIGSDELISTLTSMPESDPMIKDSGEGAARRGADFQYITKRYPEVDFNTVPVYDSANNVWQNNWLSQYRNGVFTTQNTNHGKNSTMIPQPYLCAYIREVLKALGYTLKYNAIEETDWKDTYIVHAERTCKWNLMLPGWTAKDFLTGVETFFNCTFVIDFKTRQTKLYFNNNYIPVLKVAHVRQVVDEYTVECDDEEENVVTSDVMYELPDSTWFKLRNIGDEVWEVANQETITGSVDSFFSKEENRKTNTIFYDANQDRYLMYVSDEENNLAYYETLHQFASLKRAESKSEIKLPFLPASFESKRYWQIDENTKMFLSFPTVGGNVIQEDQDIDAMSITELVDEVKEDNESKGKLYLAFYSGYNVNQIGVMPPNTYPLPYFDLTALTSEGEVLVSQGNATLRLKDLSANFYDDVYDIDTINPIEITSYDPNLFDTLSVFEIHNKYFLCKEIEYTLTAKGRDQAWKGTFYPIKLLDGEADNRWILSDGKWRDNGVWLDNGRWLDE